MAATQLTLIIACITVGLMLVGLAFAVGVPLFKGSVRLGLLIQKVDDIEKNVDKNAVTVIESINGLRQDVQQSNRTLAALANHGHDTDGRTIFMVP